MAESFENLDNILRDWARDKGQKSLAEALNKFEKQEETIDYAKWLLSCLSKWLECGAKAGFRVMLKDFEIKKRFFCGSLLFLYYIKQIDSMLPCVCSRKTSKCGKNISDTLG